jgi:D-methionine transport system permease protein
MDTFLNLFSNVDWYEIWLATGDTLIMLGVSLAFTVLLGLPLGVLMFLTSPRQLLENKPVYTTVGLIVNMLRALPFIILLIVMMPLTEIITGTSLGGNCAAGSGPRHHRGHSGHGRNDPADRDQGAVA